MPRRSSTPWSHFTPLAGLPYFLAFDVEKCETCGTLAQAANAINLHESRERLLSLGLVEIPAPLPEQYYSEKLEQCICDACMTADNS